jgi:UDP-N-acetylglucosamine--N-acetylmuramyl-(pentapeptide) pyrophosphoryl-undecaprenol N-acetylglucosamine transferase
MFAGGGTGGHLFPAIAIAEEIRRREPGAEILFVGTRQKIEARVVPGYGYGFRTIWISGFHRGLKLSNLTFPFKVIVSIMQAISIIRDFRPHVVVGTGGYVSGPVLRAAIMLKLPTLIQEQNSYPGVTTRVLARKVNEVHLTFESSRRHLRRTDNVFVTGNPTRRDLENVDRIAACTYFGFSPEARKKTLLVFGGSLGAHTINQAVKLGLDRLVQGELRIIWQTGVEDYPDAGRDAARYPRGTVWVSAFIDRMDYAYVLSDLVISRAGATTLAELTRLGKPSILVPYPHAAADHQTENARTLASQGAAELLTDREVSEKLVATVDALLSSGQLESMGTQSKKLGKPAAAGEIAQRVIHLARRTDNAR